MPCRISLLRAAPRTRKARLSIPQALLLGALHGPTELVPVSSSGHTAALPALLGWSYVDLDDDLRKSFEVALHAGSAAAWLLIPSSGVREAARAASRDRSQALLIALATLPAAVAGLALERPIQRRLGTPRSIGAGLMLGSLAMGIADRRSANRELEEQNRTDALGLGLAQAGALVPGVSRAGATLAAARLRGFSRGASWRLSARVGGPVLAGATGLKLARLSVQPAENAAWGLLAGVGASFASSLLAARILPVPERGWPLWPFAVYRSAVGLALVFRG